VEKVCKIVKDWQITISEIAGRLGLLYGTCHWILMEDLKMQWMNCWISQKWPKLPIAGHNRRQNWVYCYNPENKQESSQLKSPSFPSLKKVRQVRLNINSMLILIWLWGWWWWRQYAPLETLVNFNVTTRTTSQKTLNFILTVVRTWNVTTTLKVTTTSNKGKYAFHYWLCPGTFWYALIHISLLFMPHTDTNVKKG
jgi:hypothetical protein